MIIAVFIVAGLALFLVAIFVIGSKQNMFTSTMKINSVFETVSGLLEGSIVRFNGISVGTVDKINIISGVVFVTAWSRHRPGARLRPPDYGSLRRKKGEHESWH